MKTTIAISAVLVAALAACADKPPPREPTTSATQSTTTTSYPTQRQQPYADNASSTYGHESTGAVVTTGTRSDGIYSEQNAQNAGTVKSTPLAPPPEPALNEPEANARPAAPQPGPANAKAPDGKAPNAVTAVDQGNSKSEVAISARIRKALIASSSLSFGAKNVKVITQGTKVTLRGNVKTDAERSEIEGYARDTNGVTEVDNQLVVKK